MEGKNISSLLVNFSSIRDYFNNVDGNILSELQSAHDSNLDGGKYAWESRMKQIANNYNLVYTEPSKEI